MPDAPPFNPSFKRFDPMSPKMRQGSSIFGLRIEIMRIVDVRHSISQTQQENGWEVIKTMDVVKRRFGNMPQRQETIRRKIVSYILRKQGGFRNHQVTVGL